MVLNFTPEQESALFEVAHHSGKDVGRWVKDLALLAVEDANRLRAAVKGWHRGCGVCNLIEDEEVRHWLESQERS